MRNPRALRETGSTCCGGKQATDAFMASRQYPDAVRAREVIQKGWMAAAMASTCIWFPTNPVEGSYLSAVLEILASDGRGGKLIFHSIHYIDLIRYLTEDARRG